MESTVLSVGKSVLSGVLGYASSAAAEEVALQLGIQRDHTFIRDELEMMQAFLMAADEERDENRVVKTWVKQVRDVAYNVEDCLQDFAVRLEKLSWWRIPCTLLDRRRAAKEMKELRAQVEDVSQRNVRYHLTKGSGSKPTSTIGQIAVAGGATMSDIDEARRQRDKAKVDLVRLINKKDDDLRVIAVWATRTCDLGETSIIERAYEDLKIHKKFECYAWIRVMRPFNPTEFLKSIIEQFHVNLLQEVKETEKATLEGQVLGRMWMKKSNDLTDAFNGFVNQKSYLIVLDGLSTIEDWDCIKALLPNNKKKSRIIVSTRQVGVASLCVGVAPAHKQLAADQTLYAFCNKDSLDGTDLAEAGSSSNTTTLGSNNSLPRNRPTRTETMVLATLEESQLIGRGNEKTEIIKLISNRNSQRCDVISVWGMGGLGKTTLVRDIYQSQEISSMFEKRACVTIMRPFNFDELLKTLAMQFGGKNAADLATHLEGKRYLIVLDDVSSTREWDVIIPRLPIGAPGSCIIVTTREESIAKHCSRDERNIRKINILGHDDARILFAKKVFKETVDLDGQYPELVEQAQRILKKCKGLPLAIVTIGGFLANQPKTVVEWRKLNEHISAELEMNPELETIRTVLVKSYDGLPYHLKACFLCLPIFPEDCDISRRRLVRRWTAEGYSREVRGKFAEETANGYFMDLISRSMILPYRQSDLSIGRIESCQVHDLIREIAISKSMEENLVFRLEEGSSLNCQGTARHLVVSSNWHGDKSEFEGTVDLCRIRSLTVFGEWKPFYISDKMRMLRVLDLEDTSCLCDHHLVHIGELLHLKYLSLRRCYDIFYLPDSVGNLRQLETLDIKVTRIVKLPRTIIKLRKLHHIHAGNVAYYQDDRDRYQELLEDMPMLMRNDVGALVMASCVCCIPIHSAKEAMHIDGDFNRRDLCTAVCCAAIPAWQMRQFISQIPFGGHGVAMPREMYKLKVLQSLSLVNIWREKGALQDIKRLTWLRKLGVTGINKRNSQEFCSAVAGHSRLESLLVRSEGKPGLSGCLDSLSSPPENLQSLKLYGNLVRLPEWVEKLKYLVKLKLRSSMILEHDAAMQLLGKLPNLTILHLLRNSFEGKEVHFHRGAFPSLVVLELHYLNNLKSVEFEGGATPKLELLQLKQVMFQRVSFAGLESLPSLKQVFTE